MHLTEAERTDHKLKMFGLWLEATVPLWILQMRAEGWSFAERQERARVAGKLISERADLLIREPTKPVHHEERAELLNRLAEGVACMAFTPGGVTLFGKAFRGEAMTEYNDAEQQIAFLLGETHEQIEQRGTGGSDCYGWRAAQIASWSVPVACCIKCRADEYGSGGLTCRHTTHRQCWPEAFVDGAECRCPARNRCAPWPEDIHP